ncbi:MAG: metallophosphoesterase [Oscillospiraceae bacterium]|nr:metallophosphoesterase [Oscillospiraceae bacterium]
MVLLTGDTHRNFKHIAELCLKYSFKKSDVLVILGDVAINYFGDPEDKKVKTLLNTLDITILSIYGNHEMRPEYIPTYNEIEWKGGIVFSESKFPNLVFAKDGEIYELAGKRCIAIGGAYSVDKNFRIVNDWGWWPYEQPSDEIKKHVEANLDSVNWNVDVVLSHTCPFKYIPHERLIPNIDPKRIDNGTEKWLDTIEERLTYKHWYCGHFHCSKVVNNENSSIRFMYEDFIELGM